MAKTKTYQHFCPVARALEVIGEKWSLLIVRDLLRGPARFTDLSRTLGNITPKWLTQRLRDLEAAGLVEREQVEGKREVYYRLTPKGRELAPVVGALNVWGLRNAMREPEEEEAVTPFMFAPMLAGFLANRRIKLPGPRTWLLNYGPGPDYAVRFDGRIWDSEPIEKGAPCDLRITTSAREWATFLTLKGEDRRAAFNAMTLEGAADCATEFISTIEHYLG